MPSKPVARTIMVCLATLLLCLALPAVTPAQAWVPPKGDGSVSVSYSNMYVRNHVNGAGIRNSALGRIRSNNVVTSFEYGITDKLALSADLALVASKYIGHNPHGPDDDGSYRPTFQDLHVELLYNALNRKAWVVTPFIGATIPTHDYETRGHAAVGRGFHQLMLGANVGRQFEGVLPASYVHARYSYAIHKNFEDLNLNRSNADFEVGWFATRTLSFKFLADLQKTHGGLVTPLDRPHLDDHDIEFHDRLTRSNYINLGGGVGFAVNRSFGIHAAYLTNVYARNAHAHGGMVLGISWNFSKGLRLDQIRTNTSSSRLASSAQAAY